MAVLDRFYCTYSQVVLYLLSTWADLEGGTGDWTPAEKSQNIGFLCNTCLDPLKNHKATKPSFNVGPSSARQRNAISMAFDWWADDGPFIKVFGSSIPYLLKKNIIKFGSPLKKLS